MKRSADERFGIALAGALVLAVVVVASAGTTVRGSAEAARVQLSEAVPGDELHESVLRGRKLVLAHACGDCHGGMPNPAAEGYLAGRSGDDEAEVLGPFRVWPRNLTPDPETGIGRYSERQVFNALRYGLRPSSTPDVEITSAVPGEGNHPAQPDYLAPIMPWVFFRYMSDRELMDIAAYLKHGLLPVRHQVPEPQGPPDHWASEYPLEVIGTHELPPFPTAHEELRDESRREQVLAGRQLVNSMACAACHGGVVHPAMEGYLIGSNGDRPYDKFQIGPFATYPRNLTPDNLTGMGRFSERQIFNALRFGLRPGETPDVEITSTVPGQGNHPASPKYLAVPMPWPGWRHLDDDEIRAIAAYLKHGVKPVSHRVPDSEGPPDFWLSEYTPEKWGTWPAPPFPTARERAPVAVAR